MVVSNLKGELFEHPTLKMVGASGIYAKIPEREELSKLPEGSKFFTIPNSHPGGVDPKNNKVKIISIGPQTTMSCEQVFNRIDQEANPHDLEGLIKACEEAIGS